MMYKKCSDRTEQSIVRFITQYQVLNDRSSDQLLQLFDDKQSKVESVDLCRCFLDKFKRKDRSHYDSAFKSVLKADNDLKKELDIFFKKGLFGKFSHQQEYEAIYARANTLTLIKELINEASKDKFNRGACLL